MPATLHERPDAGHLDGADLMSAVAAESNEELTAGLEEDLVEMTAAQGRFLVRLGEVARRESFRHEGATSVGAWAVERFGLAPATARASVEVADKAPEMPQLLEALCGGEVSLDKVRAVVEVATASSEGELCQLAKGTASVSWARSPA
jgi:hypothetical protein